MWCVLCMLSSAVNIIHSDRATRLQHAPGETQLFLMLQAQILLFFIPLISGFGADFLCNRIPGLTPKQREICETAPDALAAIGEGTKLGISECQHQFQFNRWNCTPIGSSFGHVSVIGSREAAFLYAISSAGVTFAVTQACARGNISSCGCAPPTTISTAAGHGGNGGGSGKSPSHRDWGVASGWRWGGCSADVEYAVRLARKFLDSREIEGDARSLMNLHNNKAGRKAVQTTLETECKCHGVSGSCTLKTCWLKLSTFRRVGEDLLEKYKRAKPVIAVAAQPPPADSTSSSGSGSSSNNKNNPNHVVGGSGSGSGTRPRRSLILVKRNGGSGPGISSSGSSSSVRMKYQRSINSVPPRPRRSDLVYLDPSPNYCDSDSTSGSLGTKSRRCFHRKELNSTNEEQSCDILCCGRGYNTHQMWRRWKCHCKFRWCCEVECQQCQERVEIYTCN